MSTLGRLPGWTTMAESGRAKVKELLVRHSELEQSETKAQAALVTILSLTQITELKLLLDIGRQGHRFYDFVLTLLIASISFEIFVGIIIIYIGNLHYYKSSTSSSTSRRCDDRAFGWSRGGGFSCRYLVSCACCQSCRFPPKAAGGMSGGGGGSSAYQTVREAPMSGETPLRSASSGATALLERSGGGAGGLAPGTSRFGGYPLSYEWFDSTSEQAGMENLVNLERADINMEMAKVRVADADVRIVRATNYARVVEEALRKTPGGVSGAGSGAVGGANAGLEAELAQASDDVAAAMREKSEGEAEQRLAEAHQRHAIYMRESAEDRRESSTFHKVALWQHVATYLLYFIMLMNVFVTTFGISGGAQSVFTGGLRSNAGLPSPVHSTGSAPSYASLITPAPVVAAVPAVVRLNMSLYE